MTALEYLRRYPSARPSSIDIRFKRDEIHDQLRREVAAMRHPLRAWLAKFLRRV